MYTKLWEASGVTFPDLIDRLIELAIDRKNETNRSIHQYQRKSL